MAFTRTFLREQGVPEENIDAVMAERNRSMADYIHKDDAAQQQQAAVTEAVNAAKAGIPQPTETPEYKALLQENTKIKALQGEDFASVKPKFREAVYDRLDHGEGHKPYAEQITALQTDFEEFFTKPADPAPGKPQFGDQTQGGLPKGNDKPTFGDLWGFAPKKGV